MCWSTTRAALRGFFEEITPQDFRAQIETTLFGPVNVTRAVLPLMRAERSGIGVTISSTAGLSGGELLTAYAASKSAVEGWVESLTPTTTTPPADATASWSAGTERRAARLARPRRGRHPRQRVVPVDGILHWTMHRQLIGLAIGTISPQHAQRMLARTYAEADYEHMLRSWIYLDNHDTPRLEHNLPDVVARLAGRRPPVGCERHTTAPRTPSSWWPTPVTRRSRERPGPRLEAHAGARRTDGRPAGQLTRSPGANSRLAITLHLGASRCWRPPSRRLGVLPVQARA